ncbi:MAG: hypothetical protein Q8M56_17535 [Desulfobacterales bacterium]|nr:hypothetical protein [Desulfobacterales bacterium]
MCLFNGKLFRFLVLALCLVVFSSPVSAGTAVKTAKDDKAVKAVKAEKAVKAVKTEPVGKKGSPKG